MMRPFRLHPEAAAEGIEAASYIASDDALQGALFKDALENAVMWACSNPLIFRCFEDDFRKIKVGKFHYPGSPPDRDVFFAGETPDGFSA